MIQADSHIALKAATTRANVPAAVDNDPTFALIERHRAAVAAYYKIDIRTPNAEANAIWDAMRLAQYAMDETKPATLAGMVAYLDHVADDEYVHTRRRR